MPETRPVSTILLLDAVASAIEEFRAKARTQPLTDDERAVFNAMQTFIDRQGGFGLGGSELPVPAHTHDYRYDIQDDLMRCVCGRTRPAVNTVIAGERT